MDNSSRSPLPPGAPPPAPGCGAHLREGRPRAAPGSNQPRHHRPAQQAGARLWARGRPCLRCPMAGGWRLGSRSLCAAVLQTGRCHAGTKKLGRRSLPAPPPGPAQASEPLPEPLQAASRRHANQLVRGVTGPLTCSAPPASPACKPPPPPWAPCGNGLRAFRQVGARWRASDTRRTAWTPRRRRALETPAAAARGRRRLAPQHPASQHAASRCCWQLLGCSH